MIAARVAACIVVALVLQVCFFARLPIAGARPDLLLLMGIAAGFVAGADKGAAVGFASGVAFDLLLPTPLGLSALVYTVVGYGAGALGGSVIRAAWWIPMAMAAAASAVGVVLYALVGEVLGQETLSGPSLTAIVAVVAAVNAVFAPAAVWAMRRALADDSAGRRYSTR
ncbi:MAG: rod shape-determining protein MreD [Acidimicrobiales bacterium]|nr:rod shape-determining protein MreD [Acidimicrobiales bacterium]